MESARSYTSKTETVYKTNTVVQTVDVSKEGMPQTFREWVETQKEASMQKAVNHPITTVEEKKANESVKVQCLQYLIYWLFHGKDKDRLQNQMEQMASNYTNPNTQMQQITTTSTMSTYYMESEQTSFLAKGNVVTADGRNIEIHMEFSMTRRFEEYYEISSTKQFTNMMDPLVINLDSNVTTLSDQKFMFDIDSDGILDSISYLNKGSGYLALDKNGDGVINDGNELFGTKSGDGFYDLSRYDEDHNGWIDENDEIFSKLLVWSKDLDGNDVLYTLKELDIGAICLQKVETEFSLNSIKNNQTNGQIKSTGMFLYDNGTVGSMTQMDLAI